MVINDVILFDVDKYSDKELISVASDIVIKLSKNGLSCDDIKKEIMSDIECLNGYENE